MKTFDTNNAVPTAVDGAIDLSSSPVIDAFTPTAQTRSLGSAHTTVPSALAHTYAPDDPGRIGEKVIEGIDLLTGDNGYDTYAAEKIAHHLEHEQTRAKRHSRWSAWLSQMGSIVTYTDPSDSAMM